MVTEEERLDIGMAYYEDGFNEGLRKTQFEIAQKMLQKGFPINLNPGPPTWEPRKISFSLGSMLFGYAADRCAIASSSLLRTII